MPDCIQFIDLIFIPPRIVSEFLNILSKLEFECKRINLTFKAQSLVKDVNDIEFINPPLLKLS